MERPDYILSIDGATSVARPDPADASGSSSGGSGGSGTSAAPRARRDRPWIAVSFQCCNTYSRIYITADRSAFAGFCPRCAQAVRVGISPDGSDTRFFKAG